MRKIIKILTFPLLCIVKGGIYFYKFCISPFLPSCCIYKPSCSTYALQAVGRFGALKGSMLAIKRILRCTPYAKGGVDRIPEDLKGDYRWLI